MEKKLIKQLKSIGFEYDKSFGSVSLEKQIEGTTFYYNAYKFSFWAHPSSKKAISKPTFEQILEAIKEHTGVDLTPKKSKREEIEELKTKVASLEDAIKSQNKAIEDLNISKPLEVAKEITKLALKLKEMELSKTFENGGAIETAHEGESVLTDAMLNAKRDNLPLNFTSSRFNAEIESISKPKYTQDLPFSFSTPNFKATLDSISEPKSTKEQEKKAFKVGDKVIPVCKIKPAFLDCVKQAIKNKSVCEVVEVDQEGVWLKFAPHSRTYFYNEEVEHAPEEQEQEKALEWGKLAEITEDDEFFKKGHVVLVCLIDKDVIGSPFLVSCNKINKSRWVSKEVLKPV